MGSFFLFIFDCQQIFFNELVSRYPKWRFTMTIEIDKRSILLRKWKFGDEEDLVKCANNLDVPRFFKNSFPYPYTLKDAHC